MISIKHNLLKHLKSLANPIKVAVRTSQYSLIQRQTFNFSSYSEQSGGSRGGYSQSSRPQTNQRQGDFKPKKNVLTTFTLENIQDKVTLADLHENSRQKLIDAGIQELMPVQQATYNLFINNNEIIVKSRTGTGKTLSFLLPLEELIRRKKEEPSSRGAIHAIILEPTRELASQVQTQVEKFTRLKSVLVYGGGDRREYQMNQINRTKPDILVCTPGRLIDLLQNSGLQLSEAQYQILDEGDKMLDMGFEEDIIEIQKYLPQTARSMIFSATVPAFIQELAKKKFDNPILLDLVGNDTNQVPERIQNIGIMISDQKQRAKHIQRFIEENRDKKIIIFTETKQEARDFEKETYANFLTLHGDLEQSQRESRLNQYREKSSKKILVATDVASRGLDIDDIDVVIQLGCRHVDSFVHRSGRTGRVGKKGTNIIFFEKDEFKFILNLEDELNIKIEISSNLNNTNKQEILNGVVNDFKHKALRKKKFDQLDVINQMKQDSYHSETEENKEKVLNFLFHNYLLSHSALPTQLSFLQSDSNLQTYYARLEGAKSKESRQLSSNLRNYLDENRIRYIFDIKGETTHFMIDASTLQESDIQEIIGQATDIETEFREVHVLGEIEKGLIQKKLLNNSNSSRGGNDYGNQRSGGGYTNYGYAQNRSQSYSRDGGNRGGYDSNRSSNRSFINNRSGSGNKGGSGFGDIRGGNNRSKDDEIAF
ncbi:dead-box atp-dependent rna helicase 53-like [Stylonychia lemnae]|uniref:Dead-box atp-dependent rna helicase 53-like n=1 Tax=Stylonychia lemnae TaxID=5949 RepID=A0A078B676_STYLE|nr:dead-box atp-dependent rna helicase 53-like [Stylonychia lemnae]|eukprot:CDW89731.1 dead-box atp-dependent rna helicase 53-like [Stylonychia lemnae]